MDSQANVLLNPNMDLERALQIAVQAHAGQKDRTGKAYIFHPIRVMQRCRSDAAKMAALLHDVVEDTDVTLDDLEKEKFPEKVLEAVRLLTHDPKDSYEEFVEKVTASRIAIEVKLADLADNSDLLRLDQVREKDHARFEKYIRAHQRLAPLLDP